MMHETTRSAGGRPTSLALSLAIVVLSRAAPVHALDEPFRIDLVSSYDGAPTWSMVHVPDGYDPLVPVPLVLSCHGMGGDAHSAIDGVYKQTNSRGWLAVAPHTHGERSDGQTSLAARAAQHDLIDLIDWMVENYAVDEERIYLTGASMGGLQSSMSAAKYPHVFAAAWEWMGPADVEEIWYELDGSLLFQELADDTVIECGGTPDEQLFEYRRRSPADFAMNLRTVPFKIGHGRTDILVRPHHAADLSRAIEAWDPLYFDGTYWHWGSHWILPHHVTMTLDWFEDKVRRAPPHELVLTSDEEKDYYYLDVAPALPDEAYAQLMSVLDEDTNTWDLRIRDASSVGLRLDEAYLDPGADIRIDLARLGAPELVLDGITGVVSGVDRQNSPWPHWELDGDRLTLDTEGEGPVQETFTVRID